MCNKARKHNLILRPHFKTHQSLEVGSWFKRHGVDRITVSSLSMAEYFAAQWQDITVAFPANILEIDTINRLAAKIRLNILVESVATIRALKSGLQHQVGFFIEIDVGAHRTGLDIHDTTTIDSILTECTDSDNLEFCGFLSHAGHTYKHNNKPDVLAVHESSLKMLSTLKQRYVDHYPEIVVSTGDTPGSSLAEDFSGTDEIRPGNFVFFDVMQLLIGSCSVEQIAVAMACPIISVHPERNEIIIYGGGVHFSNEAIHSGESGKCFGNIVVPRENGWGDIVPDMYLKGLYQEHGIVSVPSDRIPEYKVGDILLVLPIHSCMTADVFDHYVSTADGRQIARL